MIKLSSYLLFFAFFVLIMGCNHSIKNKDNLAFLIETGEFNIANQIIDSKLLDQNLVSEIENELLFKKDMIFRIQREFSLDRSQIVQKLTPYFDDSTLMYMSQWEKENSLEFRIINGQKRYFKNTVPNLFRLSEFARKIKTGKDGIYIDPLKVYCLDHTSELISKTLGEGELLNPVKNVFDYTITVKANVVPAGELIRCWMPYPKENHDRQKNVELISINADHFQIAPDSTPQRSIYCEKIAQEGKETIFKLKYKTISFAQVYFPEKMEIKAYDKSSKVYIENTKERAPQIVFSENIKELANKICGEEKHPLKQVDLLYNWIDLNIPWASALEYCTMSNIPEYVLKNGHGDCGMQTLLFMTMARYRGIPTKWQSGWMLHPNEINLHDWCEVYYEGVGWVPLDQSFSLQDSGNKKVHEFYRTGIDAHRLIVNDDFSREFFPKKEWPRSEPIDFQRGEMEWQGGNLYFNDWNYKMKVIYE